MWIGKILGTFFGFLLLGPAGALLGLAAGHWFDRGLSNASWANLNAGGNPKAQQYFFKNTFAVMGHVAKANGRVSEKQIQLARTAMQRMGLKGARMLDAMREFKRGTASDFDLQASLSELRQHCRYRHLLSIFIELQVQTAYADGKAGTKLKQLLNSISQNLGLGLIDFTHIEAMMYGNWYSYRDSDSQQHSHQQSFRQSRGNIGDAYALLGIDRNASTAEIKRAYRKKMSENHPDKLIAKGLPKEMIDVATEKTQKIQAAYDQIKSSKGFK